MAGFLVGRVALYRFSRLVERGPVCSTASAASALGVWWSNSRPTQQLAGLPDFHEAKARHVAPSFACHLGGGPDIRRINVRSSDNTIFGRQTEERYTGMARSRSRFPPCQSCCRA
jgi:hypothetical protein